jgi:hypothetical protein
LRLYGRTFCQVLEITPVDIHRVFEGHQLGVLINEAIDESAQLFQDVPVPGIASEIADLVGIGLDMAFDRGLQRDP